MTGRIFITGDKHGSLVPFFGLAQRNELTPADILYLARQRGANMPAMVVEKALPGQRGLLVRTNITK